MLDGKKNDPKFLLKIKKEKKMREMRQLPNTQYRANFQYPASIELWQYMYWGLHMQGIESDGKVPTSSFLWHCPIYYLVAKNANHGPQQ